MSSRVQLPKLLKLLLKVSRTMPSRERQEMMPKEAKDKVVSFDSKNMKCNRKIMWKETDATVSEFSPLKISN